MDWTDKIVLSKAELETKLAQARAEALKEVGEMHKKVAGYFRHIKQIRPLTFEEIDFLQYFEPILKSGTMPQALKSGKEVKY